MTRHVEPELLDELPPEDPDAVGSRRDLRRLNAWMGNAAIVARALRLAFPRPGPRRLVELGAGDGFFMSSVVRRLGSEGRNGMVVLVDRLNAVEPEARRTIEGLGWKVETVATDALEWLGRPAAEPSDAVFANLFLHQLSELQLAGVLSAAAKRTRAFVALEPRRSAWRLMFSRMVWLVGCNRVTRHDARISVRAGFAGHELSRLWPADGNWSLREQSAGLFGHLFEATR